MTGAVTRTGGVFTDPRDPPAVQVEILRDEHGQAHLVATFETDRLVFPGKLTIDWDE